MYLKCTRLSTLIWFLRRYQLQIQAVRFFSFYPSSFFILSRRLPRRFSIFKDLSHICSTALKSWNIRSLVDILISLTNNGSIIQKFTSIDSFPSVLKQHSKFVTIVAVNALKSVSCTFSCIAYSHVRRIVRKDAILEISRSLGRKSSRRWKFSMCNEAYKVWRETPWKTRTTNS